MAVPEGEGKGPILGRPSRGAARVQEPGSVSRRLRLSLAVLVACALAAIVLGRWRVNTSIVAFLPAGDDRELYEISKSLADSSLTRRMVLSLGASRAFGGQADEQARRGELAEVAARLADELLRSPRVRSVRRGVDEADQQVLFETYFPRRYHFWSLAPERELPAALSDAGLARAAGALRDALAGPEGFLVRKLAPRDPLQVFRGFLARLEERRPGALEVTDGQFFSRDGYAILFLELADSAFDGAKQRELLAHIDEAAASLPPAGGRPVVVEASGVNRFAVSTEAALREDLQRISLLSVAGLLLLFGVLFRRPGRLLLLFVPLGFGMLTAMAGSLLLFGELHALTLAFGSALLGVAVDYPMHLAVHHDLADAGETARATFARVRLSLLMAGGTTIAGLLGLGAVGYPGMREMAIFACLGIGGALTATLGLVPWLGPAGAGARLEWALAGGFGALLQKARRRPSLSRVALGLLGVWAAVGLANLRWEDDLSALNQAEPELVEEDARVRARIDEGGAGRFIVARGVDVASALAHHETVVPRLDDLVGDGAIGGYASVDGFLRSPELQRRNVTTLRAEPRLAERSLTALKQAGFVPEQFSPFVEELKALERVSPLVAADLDRAGLGPLIAPFIATSVAGGAAVVTHLNSVTDAEAVRRAVAELPGVNYFDQRGTLDAMYRQVRARTVRLVLLGISVMLGVALLRYRSWRQGLSMVVPACASGASTFALLSLFGVELNLLHVVALLLVLGVGVDYGTFFVDGQLRDERTQALPAPATTSAALVGILVACLSTVLSFGLLALSSMPALRAIGQTVALGVATNLLLAPLVSIALSSQRRAIAPAGGSVP